MAVKDRNSLFSSEDSIAPVVAKITGKMQAADSRG
jgi:hypothetical protein